MKRCLRCEASFASREWTCTSCGRGPEARDGHLVFAPELAAGGFGDAEYTFDAIVAAEARHFWFDSRRRLVLWTLAQHLNQARSLLEVGCGTGYVLEGVRAAFSGLSLAGSDVLVASLARARPRLPGVELFQMDARRIPFREEWDAVLALDVIEHIAEDEAALAEMSRALRPGGVLVLTVPQHPWLWTPIDDWSGHHRRYTRRELVTKVERAGLRVEDVTSFSSLLLPLQLLARWRQTKENLDPGAELRIAAWMNALLRIPSALERGLIRAGLSFPVGGSLLVAARRAS